MKRGSSATRTRTFSVRRDVSGTAAQVERALQRTSEEIEHACRELFDLEGYRVQTDHLEGSIHGVRCDITGPKFAGVLSVQLVTPRDRYRTECEGGWQLRVAAHAKLVPTPQLPLFPDGALWQFALGLVIVAGLIWFGLFGTKGVVSHPSRVATIDGLGLAVTIGSVALGVLLLRRLLIWAERLPWESLGISHVPWASRDAERWRKLALRVRAIVEPRR